MQPPRRPRWPVLGALVAGTVLLAGCAGDSSDGADPGPSKPPSSADPSVGAKPAKGPKGAAGPGTGDLLVHGTLLDGGKPVAGGEVSVSVLSEGDVASGEEVPTWRSKPVRTDRKGRWAIEVDPDDLDSQFLPDDQDFLNFDLNVTHDGATVLWGATAHLLEEPQVWRTDGAGVDDQVLRMRIDLGKEQIALTDSTGETERQQVLVLRLQG